MIDPPAKLRNWFVSRLRKPAAPVPPGKRRGSLSEFVGRLVRTATTEALAERLLADDLLYRRLEPARRREAVGLALAAGARVARELVAERGLRDPLALAKALGVKVTISDKAGRVGSRVYYSDYRSRPPSIKIYQQSMDEVNVAIRRSNLGATLGVNDIATVHTAHELYHHIELQQKPSPTDDFRVTTFRIGPIRLDSGLMSLSEIAANAFAQELLGLRQTPLILEFITLYLHDEQLAWDMLDQLQTTAA